MILLTFWVQLVLMPVGPTTRRQQLSSVPLLPRSAGFGFRAAPLQFIKGEPRGSIWGVSREPRKLDPEPGREFEDDKRVGVACMIPPCRSCSAPVFPWFP